MQRRISRFIFKKSRKIDNSCDIIEDTKDFTVLGRYKLPITLTRIYVTDKVQSIITYTDHELTAVASQRLAELRIRVLADSELLKIRTVGEFTESGYRMTSYVTKLSSIGEERVFAEAVK